MFIIDILETILDILETILEDPVLRCVAFFVITFGFFAAFRFGLE